MPYTCAVTDLFGTWECFAFWFGRYQVVAVGLVPLVVMIQLWIAFQQVGIARTMKDLRMSEQATEKALATLVVDRLIEAAFRLNLQIASGFPGANRRSSTLFGAVFFDRAANVDVDQVREAAVKAFPEQASELSLLADAYAGVLALAREYREEPWEANPFDETQWTDRQRQKVNEGIAALDRLNAAAGPISGLQPHVRNAG